MNGEVPSVIIYSHNDFLEGINDIVKQIEQSEFKPDIIVGIVRGGSVPAVYLSHRLKVPVQMVHWNTRDSSKWGNESNCWIPEQIMDDGLKVLLVDDIVDGGDTIRELLADWQTSVAGMGNLPVDNIQISCMIYNTAQSIQPHFFHQTIDRNEDQRWVIFPWEA
jgi:hypoxanthine phosphoribosyltransferase